MKDYSVLWQLLEEHAHHQIRQADNISSKREAGKIIKHVWTCVIDKMRKLDGQPSKTSY